MSRQCSYRFAAGELALIPLARTRLSAVVRICGGSIGSEENPCSDLQEGPVKSGVQVCITCATWGLLRLVHARLADVFGWEFMQGVVAAFETTGSEVWCSVGYCINHDLK